MTSATPALETSSTTPNPNPTNSNSQSVFWLPSSPLRVAWLVEIYHRRTRLGTRLLRRQWYPIQIFVCCGHCHPLQTEITGTFNQQLSHHRWYRPALSPSIDFFTTEQTSTPPFTNTSTLETPKQSAFSLHHRSLQLCSAP